MHIVVAGGRGFVGRHVVDVLRRVGHTVAVVGRGEPLLGGDVVVHLALYSEAQAQEAVAALAGRAGRLVVASSGDVYREYGWIKGTEPGPVVTAGVVHEDAPLRTKLFPYGGDYEKILVERAVAPATILRLPKVYGPGDRQRTFADWVARLRAGDAVLVGERVAGWRWTHGFVEDVAEAIALAATRPEAAGRVYNVGEEHTPTLEQRARAIARVLGAGRVDVVPDAEVPVDLALPIVEPVDLVYDTRRIRDELGWREGVSEDEALARTA